MTASEKDRGLRLILYGRPRCHLCEEMLEDVEAFSTDRKIAVSVMERDVDADPGWKTAYGLDIPVLTDMSDRVICRSIFDAAAVEHWLGGDCLT